jgi:HAD superfamily hydrolase (TIGR01509 family)
MADPALVIFDCDGVLVDSEPLSLVVLSRAIAETGLTMSDDEVRAAFMGPTLDQIEAGVAQRLAASGRALPDGWLERFLAARAEAFAAELLPVPGAREAVEGVRRARLDACVASQGRIAKTQMTLALTGLTDLFADDRLFSSTMVARGKPAPDLFLHAARGCGQPPERCVVVEDTVAGVRAARSAGMRVLGYAGTHGAAALAAEGAEPFGDMRDVPALVGGMRVAQT